MADKKPKTLGEYIRVELAKGVEPVKIDRNGMSDAEWNRVRKAALEAGTLVDDQGKKVERQSVWDASFEKDKTIFDDSVYEKSYGRKPKQEQRPVDNTPSQEQDSGRITNEDRQQIDRLNRKVQRAIIEQDKIDNPDMQDLEVQSNASNGGGGSTMMAKAASMVQDAAKGAVPSDGLEKTNSDINATSGAAMNELPGSSKPKGPVNALRSLIMEEGAPGGGTPAPPAPVMPVKRYGNDAMSRAAAGETLEPPPGEAPINFDGPLPEDQASVLDPLKAFLTPQTYAMENYKPGTEQPAPAPQPVPGAQQAAAPTPEQTPGGAKGAGAGGGGGSASVSMKTSVPGSGELPASADPYAEERKRMLNAAQGAKDAHDELMKVERSRNEAEAKILDDKINFTAENEKKRLAAVNAYEETLARGQQTMNAIADERRALMNQKIDPDAFYTKGGVGRAVAATISGAMFGWLGQGMQFMQRMDNLAQQEIKNQQDELARRSNELSLIAADKKNVIAMAREAGMTQIESLQAAKVSFFESVKDRLAKVALDNPTLAPMAQLKMAEIDQKLAGDLMALKQATMLAGHQNVQDRVALMNAQTQRMELGLKQSALNAKNAGGGGLKFSPGEVGRMDAARQGLDAVKTLKGLLGPESSMPKAMYDELTKKFGQLSEAGRRQKAVEPLRRALIRLIDASAIQKADAEFWKDKISNVGMDNMSQSDLDGLVKFFISQHDAVVKTRQNLGSFAGNEQAPEFPESEM